MLSVQYLISKNKNAELKHFFTVQSIFIKQVTVLSRSVFGIGLVARCQFFYYKILGVLFYSRPVMNAHCAPGGLRGL